MVAPRINVLTRDSLNAPDGSIIYNTDIEDFEIRDNGIWKLVDGGGGSGSTPDLQIVLTEGNVADLGFTLTTTSNDNIYEGKYDEFGNIDLTLTYSFGGVEYTNLYSGGFASSYNGGIVSSYLGSTSLNFGNPAFSSTYSDYNWSIYNQTTNASFEFQMETAFADNSRILAPMSQMDKYMPVQIDGAYADAYGQVVTTYSTDLTLTGTDIIIHNLNNLYNFVQVYNTATGELITGGLNIVATSVNSITITGGSGLNVRVLVKQ